MKAEALSYFTDTHLTVIAMLLFFGTFCGFVFWIYFITGKQDFKYISELPLKDEEKSYGQ